MRPDRLIALGLVQPVRQAGLGRGEFRLPILMSHSISEGAEAGVSPYYQTATSPKVFAEHMALLRAEGCKAVSLKIGLEMLRAERPFTAWGSYVLQWHLRLATRRLRRVLINCS